MKMSDRVYDFLKWIAQIVLPASGTLYFAVAQIWGLPFGEQVVGTIVAFDTFLGAILGIASGKYEGEGHFEVISNDDGTAYLAAHINAQPDDVVNKTSIKLVNKG